MIDTNNLLSVISQIALEKKLSREKIISALEAALASAYKKEYRRKDEIIRSKIDPESGQIKFWQVKIVLDESMILKEGEKAKEGEKKFKFNPNKHILLDEAKKIDAKVEAGQEIFFPLEMPDKDFGRIAAQTAKQVILQRLREIERETLFEEFKKKEGGIVGGLVQRIERRNVFVDLNRVIALMPASETVPTEHYRPGQRLKFYLLSVERDAKGPKIILSRAHPKFISKLFNLEVPEIQEGIVEIKAIVREPGSRTKIAVSSKEEGVDAVGSCVGQRGTRVMAILNEVSPEKIDIIAYSDDPEKYVANALAPAKVSEVKILPKRSALVLVKPDQLSLAIGKDGQNVRLAAKLTSFRIDVRSIDEPDKKIDGGVAEAKEKEEKGEEEVKEEGSEKELKVGDESKLEEDKKKEEKEEKDK